MRRRAEYKIYPIDTNSNIAVGLKIPFNSKGIFGLNYTTQDQVKSNLINFMLTNTGERFYNVEYGAGLQDLIFEQSGNTEEVKTRIEDRIARYFPQITVQSLDFLDRNDGVLYITLKYSFNNNEDTLTIGVQNQVTNG